jgi:hypothetical protein
MSTLIISSPCAPLQLHKFAADVMELPKIASKELVIEAEIKKLTEVWKECKFELLKYSKARAGARKTPV